MRKIAIGIVLFFIGMPVAANAVQLSVPSAPGAGFWLVSTSTGAYIATTTNPLLAGSFIATTSLASQFPYASSTALSATTICLTGDTCRTTWPTGGSGAWPFTTTDTNFGVAVQSTTTPEWFKNGLLASSTSQLVYASSTQLSAVSLCLTGDVCRTTWPVSGGGGGSGSIGTSSPGVRGSLLYFTTAGATPELVAPIATTSLAFSGPFSGASSLGALVGGSNSTVTWTGLSTSSQPASSNVLASNGGAGVYGVATSSETCSTPLSCTPHAVLTGGGAISIQAASASQAGSMAAVDYQRLYSATTTFASGITYTLSTNAATLDQSFGAVWTAASTTFTGHVSLNTASSTQFSSATIWNSTVGNALWLGDSNGKATAYGGASACSANNFVTTLSAVGGTTCGTASISGVNLGGNLAAHTTNSSLSGTSYNGSAAVSDWGINLAHANTYTALQWFTQNASSSQFTATSSVWFTGITNGLVSADANGLLSASSSVGANFITGTLGTVSAGGALTGGGSLTRGGTVTLTCPTANGSTNGCIASTDWQAFNMKVATGSVPTLGQLAVWQAPNTLPTLGSVATTAVSCTGNVSCTAFTALGAASSIALTGQVPVANGGTNASSIGSHMILAYNGTSIVSTSTPTAAAYLATSTTATSTFAGPVRITPSGLTTTPLVLVSTSTTGIPLYGSVQGDVIDGEMDFNGIAAFNMANANAGSCAGSGIFGDGDIVAVSSDYSFFGFTNAGWTGIGCAVGNARERPESTIIANPTGDMNFEIASSSPVAFNFYASTTLQMKLDNTGRLMLGTTTPAWGLSTLGTSTRPQLALSDNVTADNAWAFRNEGGAFAIATSTAAATSSTDVVNFSLGSYLWQFFSNLLVKITSATAFVVQDGYGTSVLTVNTASSSAAILAVQATSSTDTLFSVDQYGHLTASSTKATPTVSSCGTSPVVTVGSTDSVGSVTTGSASPTACTITFGAVFSKTPAVFLEDTSTGVTIDISAVSTSAFTISMSAALNSTKVYWYAIQGPSNL